MSKPNLIASDCCTAPPQTTAVKLAVRYRQDAPESPNPNKFADREDDGQVNSASYDLRSQRCEEASDSRAETDASRTHFNPQSVDLDYHHPLEDWLGRPIVRKLLRWLSKDRTGGRTRLEQIIESYANPRAPRMHRVLSWLFHRFIDRMRGQTPREVFRERIGSNRPTVRGLVSTARSVAEFGLTVPQRFAAPLFCVWNFTNACNLACRHCYQDAHRRLADELTLDEKLSVIEQVGRAYMPMIAFAGGEPTISPDLLPVLRRCREFGIHTSVATNGTTMTPELAGKLAEAGARYVEISLDSTRAERHDAFRGVPGMWQRSVAGMKAVVATPGLRLGIAMCVTRSNFDEVDDMVRFAVDIGAGCLAHFNFIPVGRGIEMADEDLDPEQREWLLNRLNEVMQEGRIGVISTAPQLGRVCLAHAPVYVGRVAATHAGSGSGVKTRVVSKYLGGCGAGRTYICIEPDGNVTPCVYMPQRVLGNVRRRPLIDIFRDNEFADVLCRRDKRLGHCEVCTYRNYCGGCRARSDAYYGYVNGPDPGCIFNDKHWEELKRRETAAKKLTTDEHR